MRKNSAERGFTVVEMLVVVSIISILAVMGVVFSSKAYIRRDVERVANQLSSELNLMRMTAMRKGVEYRLEVVYNDGCQTIGSVEYCNYLRMRSLRGDSNLNSSGWGETDDQILGLNLSLKATNQDDSFPTAMTLTFRPNGTLVESDSSVTVFPASASDPDKVKNCGLVDVNGIGRVRVYKGVWDPSGPTCKPIRDVP